jgi:hypothetical protein
MIIAMPYAAQAPISVHKSHPGSQSASVHLLEDVSNVHTSLLTSEW